MTSELRAKEIRAELWKLQDKFNAAMTNGDCVERDGIKQEMRKLVAELNGVPLKTEEPPVPVKVLRHHSIKATIAEKPPRPAREFVPATPIPKEPPKEPPKARTPPEPPTPEVAPISTTKVAPILPAAAPKALYCRVIDGLSLEEIQLLDLVSEDDQLWAKETLLAMARITARQKGVKLPSWPRAEGRAESFPKK
jgi:hypothetical protein